MGPCSQCKFFRRVKPASQLLAAIFPAGHADIAQALNKIVEDESKQRDEESQYKRAQAAAGKSGWAYRPVMSDYCGVNEGAGDYQIAEVLNAGQQCDKFVAGKPERHACSECVHRKQPGGTANDTETEQAYNDMVIKATATNTAADQPQALLKAHREGSAARRAFELAGIYAAKGVLASPPTYADYCGALSTPDEYVICALYNAHNTCDKWQGAASSPRAAPADAPDVALPIGSAPKAAPYPRRPRLPQPAPRRPLRRSPTSSSPPSPGSWTCKSPPRSPTWSGPTWRLTGPGVTRAPSPRRRRSCRPSIRSRPPTSRCATPCGNSFKPSS